MPDNEPEALTFLFTDIEGSTKLWEERPSEMKVALALHDDILRREITAAGGEVFKTVGDAFCAVFDQPERATHAAVKALVALEAEPWPEDVRLKVRMALHRGQVEHRDDDYFGPTLNRVARILAAGHGGQILVSQSATEGLDLQSFRSLGEHRLKDLGQPERLYQLLHAGLQQEFPPLRSLDHLADKHNIPNQTTSFIGRDAEVGEVKALFSRSRLLTLTGSGGVGKTRLALQVLADVLDSSCDGIWIVDLAPLTDPETVVSTIGSVLRASQGGLDAVTQIIGGGSVVVMLDNCEHLLNECARVVDILLRQCPKLKVVTTSREPLGLVGEQIFSVPSLGLPDSASNLQGSLQAESVRLFCDRARLALSSFVLRESEVGSVSSICRRLDGIPFAIELAAARVKWLSVTEINQQLDQRFRLLTGGSRTALPRQQTLRSLMDWSYDLLDPQEKEYLIRLSVFSGGWNLDHAASVVAGEQLDTFEVMDVLISLSAKNLVVADQSATPTRYRFLETVRQYARDRLVASGRSDHFRSKHSEHFLRVAKEAEQGLSGGEQQHWFAVLDTELDNVRAALDWTCSQPAPGIDGLAFIKALWRYWYVRGLLAEGSEWGARALATGSTEPTPELDGALKGVGVLAAIQGVLAEAKDCFEKSLRVCEQLDDKAGAASAYNNLSNIAQIEGDMELAKTWQEAALETFREVGDKHGVAKTLNNLAITLQSMGEHQAARGLHEEALALNREMSDTAGVALSLHNLGWAYEESGETKQALAYYEECLELRLELNHKAGLAETYANLGDLFLASGDLDRAESSLSEELKICQESGNSRWGASCLNGLALVNLDRGDAQKALALLRQGFELRPDAPDPRSDALLYECLAEIYLAMGYYGDAVQLYALSSSTIEAKSFKMPRIARNRRAKCEALIASAFPDAKSRHALAAASRSLSPEDALVKLNECKVSAHSVR